MSVAAYRFDNEKRRRADDHPRQRMLTPSYVLEPIRAVLGGIALDPCTEPDNPTGAETFYALPTDGCVQSWDFRNVFVNPPYGQARERWVQRCIDEGRRRPVVLLMPAATETRVCQAALETCHSVVFVRARVRFAAVRRNGTREAASHGSAMFGFNIDLTVLELGVSFTRKAA